MERMTQLRDYDAWHRHYDDPESGLSWRLRKVQAWIGEALDAHPGPYRVLSLCSGDGRDIVGVLRHRLDAERVGAVLVELHPEIAQRARESAVAADLTRISVRTGDAGTTDAYAGAVPADLVLLVGIMGNISDEDLWRLIDASPQLCAPGAHLIWSRGRDIDDLNDQVRARFAAAGFAELAYATNDETRSRIGLGMVRYDGPPVALQPGQRLFQFVR
jgi:SAM-dependent methyltransferase